MEAEHPRDKKYWNDQIKAMLGPCMITFSIPLTIPGLTITLVAFSEDTTFDLYGPLHIIGLLLLALSVILIILGCILRMAWKPIIGPDIEMHLSPIASATSVRPKETESSMSRTREIYTGSRQSASHGSPRPNESSRKTESSRSTKHSGTVKNVKEKKIDPIPDPNSSGEGTGSDSESTTIITRKRKTHSDFRSPRGSRHLMNKTSELQGENISDTLPESRNCASNIELEDIQKWRNSKRKKKKLRETINDGYVSENVDDSAEIADIKSETASKNIGLGGASRSDIQNNFSNENQEESGQELPRLLGRSPRQVLLPKLQLDGTKKRKKKKKKKSTSPKKQIGENESDCDIKDGSNPITDTSKENEKSSESEASDLPEMKNINQNTDVQDNGSDENHAGSEDPVLPQFTYM